MTRNLQPWEIFSAPVEVGRSAWKTFLDTFQSLMEEQHKRREARLQLDIAKPQAVPAESAEKRMVKRLIHNAPALRPFLEHNKPLMAIDGNPVVCAIQVGQAKSFIVNFHHAERALQHQMGIPHSTWQADAYSDELSRKLAGDSRLYQQVAGFSHASESDRHAIVGHLAGELCHHEQRQLQME